MKLVFRAFVVFVFAYCILFLGAMWHLIRQRVMAGEMSLDLVSLLPFLLLSLSAGTILFYAGLNLKP